MEIDRNPKPRPPGISVPARLVIGGLALFGAVSIVQWVLSSLLGIVRFGIVIAVVVAIVVWVLTAKGNR